MESLDTKISNFLRDAQYRIAVLSTEILSLKNGGSYLHKKLYEQRESLILFMNILYEGNWYISDGYNHIVIGSDAGEWTEREIISEIEYLRYYTHMNEAPSINFTAHYPQIVSQIGTGNSGSGDGGSGVSFPTGNPGDSIFYNALGLPYADSISSYGGMDSGQSINSYFSGRL
jgi:hypothetical protein